MLDYEQDYMQMMNMYDQYPMAEMSQPQLESMYPRSYYIIQPAVESACDRMEYSYGQMYTPTRAQLEAMIDDVYARVASDVDASVNENPGEEARQIYGGGRRLLRDFIGALLIGSLIRRRRPRFIPGFGRGFRPGRRYRIY